MINRRNFLTGLAAAGLTSNLSARDKGQKLDIGLELYSLRDDMKRDVPGTLALVRRMGFDHVEVPSFYGLAAVEFRRALDQAELRATALVAQYDDLKNNLASIQRNLDTVGARWAILPWITHGDIFERADAVRGSNDMNAWSKGLQSSGHKFAYHLHGYEFQPAPEGTLFDVIAHETDPETVNFQLDTFWIVWPGQDCVALMKRYPNRFRLLHLKDLRKSLKTGDLSGHAPMEDSVVLGTGVVRWKQVFDTAVHQHVEDYFIEDENPNAVQQIPQSLDYLRKLNII